MVRLMSLTDKIVGHFKPQSANTTQLRPIAVERIFAMGIVMVGFYFRSANIFDQAPVSTDDYYYVTWPKEMLAGSGFPGIMKPLWVTMVAMGNLVMGYRLYVAALLSAFCGTLIVAVMYRLGSRLFGRSTGLYAGVLSASLLTYIHLSRWSQGHMTSMLLILSAALLYEEGARSPSRRAIYLGLSGMLVGASLYVHAIFMSMVPLLLLWAIGDGVANLRRHGSFKEAIAGPLFLTTGIGLSIIAPEMIVRLARISGVNAASWMGGLYETIFRFPSNLATGNSFDLQALLAYVHVFSENEGIIMTFAVALGTGMLAWQAWKSRSGSVLRGISILIFTFFWLEISTVVSGVQMDKFVTGLLPGVPLVLGYLLARVARTISVIQPTNWHVGRSAMVQVVVVCGLVAGWGYWHSKARIEWTTGHNDAYVLVQRLRPERIFYSGSIWDFHFGGMANALAFDSGGFEKPSKLSGQDVVIVTRPGGCEDNQKASYDLVGFQSSGLHLIASLPAFDHTLRHDISPTLAELGKSICHAVYSFR